MPTQTFYNAGVAAGANTGNIVAGSMFEFLRRPAIVRIASNGSAVGMTARITLGDRTILDNMPISAANRFPVVPDDYIVGEPGLAGERLSIIVTNTTAGALNVWTKVDIEEL